MLIQNLFHYAKGNILYHLEEVLVFWLTESDSKKSITNHILGTNLINDESYFS